MRLLTELTEYNLEQFTFEQIYLHFFNREIYRSILGDQIDNVTLDHSDIILTILISGKNNLYCSYSAFWETYYILNQNGKLFRKLNNSNLLTVVDETLSQNMFMSTKQIIYEFDLKRYTTYFDELPELLLINPTVPKNESATDIIDNLFLRKNKRLLLEFAPTTADMNAVKHGYDAIYKIVKSRGDKAITASLFKDSRLGYGTQNSIGRVISSIYLRHYQDFLYGDIITGVEYLLEYDYLSRNFPFFDYPILNTLLQIIGFNKHFHYTEQAIDFAIKYYDDNYHIELSQKLHRLVAFIFTQSMPSNTISNKRHIARYRELFIKTIRHLTFDFKCNDIDLNSPYLYEEGYRNLNNLQKHIEEKYNNTKDGIILPKNNDVFVVSGRNEKLRLTFFQLIRALGLNPLEWTEALSRSGEPSPYVGDVIEKNISEVGAVIVLLAPEETAHLNAEFINNDNDSQPQLQPRPNVLFEAGMAYGINKRKTILVQFGHIRGISDILGRHVVRFDNTPEKKMDLAERLRTAGCRLNKGTDFLKIDVEY